MTIIHIHEFSTGILVDGTDDTGKWKSRGFSGEYMNSTLASIPEPVQLAIKNREFAVAEGASSENPAIIGREVEYNGEAWSVIAVVTRGMDERGRGASLYRYFLCEGLNKLPDLVSWYMRNGKPTFNPSDHKQVGDHTEYNDTETKFIDHIPPELDGIWKGETPIIIPQKQPPHTALIIHRIASKTDSAKNDELISWACNVEALQRPNRFLVIYPASEKAEETIRATINSVPQLPPAIPEEPLIRTAIKNSCRTGKFQQDNLATLEDALNNHKIQQDYTTFWNSIFEGECSKDAYQQGIYSEYNVRLLTLQAIICPEKLPDFVDWIMKKEEDCYPISQRFQGEIVKAINPQGDGSITLPTIFNKITQGINILIPNVIEHPDLIDATAKLLQDGLWGRIYRDYTSKKLKEDLNKKETAYYVFKEKELCVLNDPAWQKIKNDLTKVFNDRFYWDETNEKYIHLALLFNQIEAPSKKTYKESLTVFFYHLAQEKIPSDVYKRHKLKGDEGNNFGIKVKRDIPWYEPVFKIFENYFSSNFKEVIPSVIIIFVILSSVFTLGGFFFQRLLNLANLSVPGLPGGSYNSESPIIKKAIKDFSNTEKSLEQIKKYLINTTRADNSKSNPQEDEIDEAISKILDPNDKEAWVKAILQYQESLKSRVTKNKKGKDEKPITITIPVNGVIIYGDDTYNLLKCDVAAKLGKELSNKPEICNKVKPIDESTPPPG